MVALAPYNQSASARLPHGRIPRTQRYWASPRRIRAYQPQDLLPSHDVERTGRRTRQRGRWRHHHVPYAPQPGRSSAAAAKRNAEAGSGLVNTSTAASDRRGRAPAPGTAAPPPGTLASARTVDQHAHAPDASGAASRGTAGTRSHTVASWAGRRRGLP